VDKVAGARLHLVDGGHMLPLTQPTLTAGFIRQAAVDATGDAALRTGSAR
jgi:carboxypeptidase C (cathepsin A)